MASAGHSMATGLALLESAPEIPRPAFEASKQDKRAFDAATKNHIRNIDSYLGRMLEDQVNGRNQIVQEIRAEIRLLARTIAALAEDDGR